MEIKPYRVIERVNGSGLFINEPSTNHVNTVIFGGGSLRRHQFLTHLFQGLDVQQIPLSEEPDLDVLEVAAHKVEQALNIVADGRSLDNSHIVLSVDTQTNTPALDARTIRIISKRHGKPKSSVELAQTFQDMHSVTIFSGQNPTYTVNSGTQMMKMSYGIMASQNSVDVELDRSGIAELITSEGLRFYMDAVKSYYGGLAIDDAALREVSFDQIAAGFSIGTFVWLGLVRSISGIPIESVYFPEALKQAIYTVAVGIDQDILGYAGVDTAKAVDNWDYLRACVDRSLHRS